MAALRRTARAAGLRFDRRLLSEIAAEIAARGGGAPEAVGDVCERRRDRGARRAAGIFYTPPHLVDFVIEHTVGRALAERPAERALELRVIDPACGAGAFLVAALARISAHVIAGRPGWDPAEVRRCVARQCLIGIDLDPEAVDACRLALALAGGDGGADIRLGDGLVCDVPGADVVIGNPPWGQKRLRLPAAAAAEYRRRFRTATGVLDPFKLFVERAHQIARPGARWGMVLPDIVLLKDQQPVRDVMLEGSELEWIAHAGRAFPGVNLDAAVVIGRRSERVGSRHQVAVWHQLPATWRSSPPPTLRQSQNLYRRLPGHKLNIHITERALALIERLEAGARLGQRFEIHEGVHTGNARRKLIVSAAGRGREPLVVGGKELARYRLAWAGAYLDRSPGAIDRAAGDYCNLGRPRWHRAKKIVVRRTGDRVIAAYDPHGLYVTNNLFVLVPRAGMTAAELRAHVALLNSRLMTWYFRTIQPRTGRLFAELKIQHLEGFPLPGTARWSRAIAELAELAARGEREGEAAVVARVDAVVERLFALRAGDRFASEELQSARRA